MKGHYELEDSTVVWRFAGELPIREGLELLRTSLEAARSTGRTGWHLLADLRFAEQSRNQEELRAIARVVTDRREILSGRLACVVADALRHGMSRMLGAYMAEHGIEVLLFADPDEARQWLLASVRAEETEGAVR